MKTNRKPSERILREAKFVLFQRRIYEEAEKHPFEFTPYMRLFSRPCPIKPAPAIQANKIGVPNVSV